MAESGNAEAKLLLADLQPGINLGSTNYIPVCGYTSPGSWKDSKAGRAAEPFINSHKGKT
jgi:hypothetical protein